MEPKKYLVIKDGVVTNIVIATEDYASEQGWQLAPDQPVNIGSSFVDGKWVHPDDPTPEQILQQNIFAAKAERNRRLQVSDWTQALDVPLTQEQKATWATYRQALRDVPQQEGFPENIVWPTQPE
jgi:hypothetical protein